MKPRILIIDTYYPDFLKTVPVDPTLGYEANLRKILDRGFGTADFYSRNLRALGWDAVDVIANHRELQILWNFNVFVESREILNAQIEDCKPDVVFLQDLSIQLGGHRPPLLAAQCSCPWPGDDAIRRCDVVFTSFPGYVPSIEALGVRAIYNPLAFDPSVLMRESKPGEGHANPKPITMHDVVFIGGVGNPSHWKYGMEVLEHVANEIPTFKWWGYGVETLSPFSPLRPKYQGEAYGLDMYEILLRSKIVINRHGEVAEGYANNMRMFEATGCGAMLLTESAENLPAFFAYDEVLTYRSPAHAVDVIRFYLGDDYERRRIAANGQKRTLADHTYAQRMVTVSDTLKEMLCLTGSAK